MSQPGGGGQESSEGAYTLLWVVGIIFIVGLLIWHFWGNQLKWFFILVKKYEVMLLSLFFTTPEMHQVQSAIDFISLRPSALTLTDAGKISDFIGSYYMYLAAFILIVLAIIVFRGNIGMRFTRAHNMDTLVQQEKDNWPQIAPIADLSLIEADIRQGPWAMCMNPMQFSRHHQLLHLERVPDRKAAWRSEGMIQATLEKEKARQIFSTQLGPLWSGVNNLSPHTKALYAAFAARIEHDTDACLEYLKKLSISAAKGAVDYSDTDAYLKKYGNAKGVQHCIKHHAYVLTIMASMLVLARVDGVLPAANFLWLKPVDRRLWYVLNTVGRQVAPSEIGGAYAHWIAEKQMGRALTVPMVDEAVLGLEKALANMVYIPDDDENI